MRSGDNLLEVSAGITAHFGTAIEVSASVRSLQEFAAVMEVSRQVFNEYLAVGSFYGAYMVHSG